METAFERQMDPYTLNELTEFETMERLGEMAAHVGLDPDGNPEPVQEPWEVEHGEDR